MPRRFRMTRDEKVYICGCIEGTIDPRRFYPVLNDMVKWIESLPESQALNFLEYIGA